MINTLAQSLQLMTQGHDTNYPHPQHFAPIFQKCLVLFQTFIVKQPRRAKFPTKKWKEKKQNKDFCGNYHYIDSSMTHCSQTTSCTREPCALMLRWLRNTEEEGLTAWFSGCLHTSVGSRIPVFYSKF